MKYVQIIIHNWFVKLYVDLSIRYSNEMKNHSFPHIFYQSRTFAALKSSYILIFQKKIWVFVSTVRIDLL